MHQVVRQNFKDHTVIAVAHRLDSIMDFDQVMVMKAGRLVECASPGELLRQDSVFKNLCDRQGLTM